MNAVLSLRVFEDVPVVVVLSVLTAQWVKDDEDEDEKYDNDTPPSYRSFVKHVGEFMLLLEPSLFTIKLSFIELQFNNSDSSKKKKEKYVKKICFSNLNLSK